jgi:hypothetical protein
VDYVYRNEQSVNDMFHLLGYQKWKRFSPE